MSEALCCKMSNTSIKHIKHDITIAHPITLCARHVAAVKASQPHPLDLDKLCRGHYPQGRLAFALLFCALSVAPAGLQAEGYRHHC